MEDILETYQIENIEQVRALADELRIRIVEALGRQELTAKQVALLLDEAPAKVHYHLHELEKVGLVKLVDIREKGNMLEKYYRAVARTISIPETLFQRTPDETIAAIRDFFQQISQRFIQVLTTSLNRRPEEEHISVHLEGTQLWMTQEEHQQFAKDINALIEPYQGPRAVEGAREYTFVEIMYPILSDLVQEDTAEAGAPTAEAAQMPAAEDSKDQPKQPYHTSTGLQFTSDEVLPKKARMFGAGGFSYSRKGLEEVIAQGKQLDIQVLGYCSFADDVTPELIDRAIARFRCRGKVNASPEVREALKRKEGKPAAEK